MRRLVKATAAAVLGSLMAGGCSCWRCSRRPPNAGGSAAVIPGGQRDAISPGRGAAMLGTGARPAARHLCGAHDRRACGDVRPD